jgi:hypothetical protein
LIGAMPSETRFGKCHAISPGKAILLSFHSIRSQVTNRKDAGRHLL